MALFMLSITTGIINNRDVDFWTFPATPRLQQSSSSWLAQPDDDDLTWMVDAQVSKTSFQSPIDMHDYWMITMDSLSSPTVSN